MARGIQYEVGRDGEHLPGDAISTSPAVREGTYHPFGRWGELGFRNERQLLVLTVPLPAANWIQTRLAGAIVRGPDHLLSQDRTARVARFWIRMRPGMSAAFPLGMLGEIGIEWAE